MGALMQIQRWKLRRQVPWLGRVQRTMFFILTPTAVLLFVAAIAGWESGATPWLAFAGVSVAAVESGWMWRYVAGAPTGDQPPLPDDVKGVALAAYRRQLAYAAVLVGAGIAGLILGAATNPLNLIWGAACLVLGLTLAWGLLVLIRPRLSQLPDGGASVDHRR